MKRTLFTILTLILAKASFATCSAAFTYAASPSGMSLLQYYVSNTSSWGTVPSGDLKLSGMNWGDGSGNMSLYSSYAYHNFPSTGTYTVKLWITIYDSSTTSVYCTDTVSHTITVSYPTCGDTIAVSYGSSGAVTFTANCPAGTSSGFTYGWDFGDGTTWGWTNPVTHTYAHNGTYTVRLYDTVGTCTYINTTTIIVTSGTWDCSMDTAKFYYGGSGLTSTFSSSTVAPSPLITEYFWYFGDGSSTSGSSYTGHTYSSAGTYTVKLITKWYDSSTSTVVCIDSITHSITAAPLAHKITGTIYKDTLYSPATADYKIWLIVYDSTSHMISAVDSTLDTGASSTYYEFNNPPSNTYLIKAAITNGPSSGSGYVPTYSTTSTSWSGAARIYYNTSYGTLSGEDIYMQHGTVTSGPGFIAGDVRYGAGKGTAVGDPVPGLLMMVRDGSNNLVASTLTDASGNYSFGSLPLGSYYIYPEALGYNITASNAVNITSSSTSISNINFKKTSKAISPIGLGVNNVAAIQSFNIYPNPTSGKVMIQWNDAIQGTATVTVTNITGQKLFSTKLLLDNTGVSELNLSQLQNGIYFMNIESDNGASNQKLVIQH
jgi:PKD repeat protein